MSGEPLSGEPASGEPADGGPASDRATTDVAKPRSLWHRLLPWGLALYTAGLVTGTHLPPEIGPEPLIPDKVIHFGAYLGLAWLLGLTLASRGRRVWVAVPLLLVFGAVDELTQIPVGRTADVWDWLADAAGIMVGTTIAWAMTRADDSSTSQ